MTNLTNELIDLATSAGASGVGITTAEPFSRAREGIEEMVESGRSARLRFVFDDPGTATSINASFPWARSLLVIGVNYLGKAHPPAESGALVARFASSNHYEAVQEIADSVARTIRHHGGAAEVLIDDNRLVDRAVAIRAGIGWRGRSTMVLAPLHGPWMLLGSVVTDLELDPTPPMTRDCGACVECLPACPTGAITEQGIDARKCLSAALQTPGSIPHWIRPHLGRRIYGCDDCLTSCPPGARALGSVKTSPMTLAFETLLSKTDDELVELFNWWYIPRREGRFIRRNLLIAAGNSREAACHQSIESHLVHTSSMIRGHAMWALARSLGHDSMARLSELAKTETVPEAREELRLATLMVDAPNQYDQETRA